MNTQTSLALGTVKTAIQRLLHRYPLFAGVVAAWRLESGDMDTVGIGMNAGEFVLYFDPEFVTSIPLEQLVGVLHHEARHVVYGHVLLNPGDYDDPMALTVAEEVTVNEDLPEPLPKGAVLLRNFPQLPPDEDTQTRYKRLQKKKQRGSRGSAPDKSSAVGKKGGRSSAPSDAQSDATGDGQSPGQGQRSSKTGKTGRSVQSDDSASGDKDGTGKGHRRASGGTQANGHSSRPGTKQPTPGGTVPTLDDHDRWEEIRDQESVARTLVDVGLREALGQQDSLPESEKALVERAAEGWGLDPGELFSELDSLGGPQKVDWRHQLRRCVGRELEQSPSFARPARRFPDLLGIVPGQVRRSAKPRIVAIIDTSASLTDEMLTDISNELTHMAKNREVYIVECDAEIHAVYRYAKPIEEVSGRGGTDLRPPLEPSFLRKMKADLAVYFTDGCGPAPDRKPQVPVVWCLTPGDEPPAAWGRVVRMG